MARKVTARMAGFSPGTSPPPVRMPIFPRMVLTFAITVPFRGDVKPYSLHGLPPLQPNKLQQANVGGYPRAGEDAFTSGAARSGTAALREKLASGTPSRMSA